MWLVTLAVVIYLVWLFGSLVLGFIKGFMVGLELRKMRKRGIDRTSHPIFQDAKWAKYFQGVKAEIEANQPKVTVILEPELCLSDRLESIQDSWKTNP